MEVRKAVTGIAVDRNVGKITVRGVIDRPGVAAVPADVEKYGHQANLHYRGQKADIHEGGHRVPMLVRWPGHTPADREEAELLCLVDWFATLADVLGVRIPEDKSLLAQFDAVAHPPRPQSLITCWTGGAAWHQPPNVMPAC